MMLSVEDKQVVKDKLTKELKIKEKENIKLKKLIENNSEILEENKNKLKSLEKDYKELEFLISKII